MAKSSRRKKQDRARVETRHADEARQRDRAEALRQAEGFLDRAIDPALPPPRWPNLGNGDGYSNKQVIETVREVTGHSVHVKLAPRRADDAIATVADSGKARRELGCNPPSRTLREIVADAWQYRLTAD
jgi:nucleoside-diphosphate-sugar epimerase